MFALCQLFPSFLCFGYSSVQHDAQRGHFLHDVHRLCPHLLPDGAEDGLYLFPFHILAALVTEQAQYMLDQLYVPAGCFLDLFELGFGRFFGM